jgi:hypothetical protein
MEMIASITPGKMAEASMATLTKGAKIMVETAAILERKPVNPFGDGKIRKVTVEFYDPLKELEQADGEAVPISSSSDFDEEDEAEFRDTPEGPTEPMPVGSDVEDEEPEND